MKQLYDAYVIWSEGHGYAKADPAPVFGRNLAAAVPHVRVRGRAPNRFYEGVGLRAAAEGEIERARRAAE